MSCGWCKVARKSAECGAVSHNPADQSDRFSDSPVGSSRARLEPLSLGVPNTHTD